MKKSRTRQWQAAGVSAATLLLGLPVLLASGGAASAAPTEATSTPSVGSLLPGAISATPSATPTATIPATPSATPSSTTSATPTATATATVPTTPSATPSVPGGPVRPPGDVQCTNPAGITLDRAYTTPGRPVTVTVSAPAGADVELQAYSRPTTTFTQVRRSTVGESGTISFDVTPGTNTRLFADCVSQTKSVSAQKVINVRTALSLTVVRNGRRDYTFEGRILPRRAGQLITLYRVTRSGERVLTSQLKTDATGTYRIRRVFTGSGTFGFVTRTGQTLTNAYGESNTPKNAAGQQSGRGRTRPTAIY